MGGGTGGWASPGSQTLAIGPSRSLGPEAKARLLRGEGGGGRRGALREAGSEVTEAVPSALRRRRSERRSRWWRPMSVSARTAFQGGTTTPLGPGLARP